MPVSYDKLTIIRKACRRVGETPPQVEDDGSIEWEHASDAYDSAIGELIEKFDWLFAERIVQLTAVDPTPSQRYSQGVAYARPAGAVHVHEMTIEGVPVVDFETCEGAFCFNGESTDTVMARVSYLSANIAENVSYLFAKALRLKVEAALVSGLQEDQQGGRILEAEADDAAREAKKRNDEQSPHRTHSRGRVMERRRGYARV